MWQYLKVLKKQRDSALQHTIVHTQANRLRTKQMDYSEEATWQHSDLICFFGSISTVVEPDKVPAVSKQQNRSAVRPFPTIMNEGGVYAADTLRP